MMFYVPTAERMSVIRTLASYPGEVMNFHFTPLGAQSWTLD